MATLVQRTTGLPSGEVIPILGQGTWHMGEDRRKRTQEIAALRTGIELGLSVIDTAEMYGDGAAEELLAEAILGRRDDVFLVSKVLPENAARGDVIEACARSLRRLRTDHIDLYLLHWRGLVPLEETLAGFEALQQAGHIRYWGVSNFDTPDMEQLVQLPGGDAVASDQVLYNLMRRGVEYDLLPWCRMRNIPVMAYSPIEQGRLLKHPTVRAIALRYGATPAQIALAWVLRQEGVVAIPKAATPAHVRENREALEIRLSGEDIAALDVAFPPPEEKLPLELL